MRLRRLALEEDESSGQKDRSRFRKRRARLSLLRPKFGSVSGEHRLPRKLLAVNKCEGKRLV